MLRCEFTEEAQSICLVATFLVLLGMCQRTLGAGMRLLQMASQRLCLSQGETTGCRVGLLLLLPYSAPSPA